MLQEGKYDEYKYIELVRKNRKLKYSITKKHNTEHALKVIVEDRDLPICKLEAKLKHVRSRLHQFTRLKIPKRMNPSVCNSSTSRIPSANGMCSGAEAALATDTESASK